MWQNQAKWPKTLFLLVLICLLGIFFNAYLGIVLKFLPNKFFQNEYLSNTFLEMINNQSLTITHSYDSFKIPGCHCLRYAELTTDAGSHDGPESTCSSYATSRGVGQNVFSYTYYRPRPAKKGRTVEEHLGYYLQQMIHNLKIIKEYYPGWLVRLYHNVSPEDTLESDYICSLYCEFDIFDPCHVEHLPTIGNLSNMQPIGRTWRFSVMGDPTVAIFFSRDTDSVITEREVSAVNEWLNSNKSFHMMKDSPAQKMTFLAGLWGVRNSADLAKFRDRMFMNYTQVITNVNYKQADQELLETVFFPNIDKDDLLVHASYDCTKYGKSAVPFPTKRDGLYWVGWGHFKKGKFHRTYCPIECRPKDHQDWVYC